MTIATLKELSAWSDLIKSLQNFCEPLIPRLDELYHWDEPDSKPPAPAKFDVDLSWSSAEWNRQLKLSLSTAWREAQHSQRVSLAHWVVSVWGGVKRNQDDTIEEHVKRAYDAAPTFPFKGVASYSKILAASNPERYAIYDARVAASLNALQLRLGANPVWYFPIPAGQNRAVQRFAKTLPREGSVRVVPDDAYSAYLEALHTVRERLECKLCEVEMVLFALASRLAREECAAHFPRSGGAG